MNDWNLDGIGDDAGDELVEIVNPAATAFDLSDWALSDGPLVPHIFAAPEPGGATIIAFGALGWLARHSIRAGASRSTSLHISSR